MIFLDSLKTLLFLFLSYLLTSSLVVYASPEEVEDKFNCSYYIELSRTGNISRLQVPFECEKYPLIVEIFLGIILSIIVVGASGGNFLVILAVLLVNKLRTPSNILIVNLAASDFLVSCIVMPIMVYSQLKRFRWPFSELFCDVYISFDVLLCTSSILNLCAISIDRYLVITRPMDYSRRRTNSLMAAMIAIAWFISALISIPPAIGWKEAFVEGSCEYSKNLGYQIYATFGAFYIPLFVMLVLYYRIFKLARRMAIEDNKRMVGISQLTTDDDETNNTTAAARGSHVSSNNNTNNTDEKNNLLKVSNSNRRSRSKTDGNLLTKLNRKKNRTKKSKSNNDSKAIRTLGVIMGCFTLCWLPFFIIQIIKPILIVLNIKPELHLPAWLFEFFLWLGYLNSFLNPIIYAKFNREFRNPFKEILLCHCRSINQRLRSDAYAEQYGLSRHRPSPPQNMATLSPSNPRMSDRNSGGGSAYNLNHSHGGSGRPSRRRSSDPFTNVSKRNKLGNSAATTPAVQPRTAPREKRNIDQQPTLNVTEPDIVVSSHMSSEEINPSITVATETV